MKDFLPKPSALSSSDGIVLSKGMRALYSTTSSSSSSVKSSVNGRARKVSLYWYFFCIYGSFQYLVHCLLVSFVLNCTRLYIFLILSHLGVFIH